MLNRFAVELFGHLIIFEQSIDLCFVGSRLQINDIGVRVLRRLGLDPPFLLRAQGGAQLTRDFGRELALESERIRERPVVALRPEMPIVPRVDELHADDDAVPVPTHTSFQDIDHAQSLRDLRQVVLRRAPIRHD